MAIGFGIGATHNNWIIRTDPEEWQEGYLARTSGKPQPRTAALETVDVIQSYIDRVPRSAVGPERLGRAYLLQSRFAAAVPPLRAALAREPDTPGLRGFLIEALEGQARELDAKGLAAEAEPLLSESRALRASR